MRYIALVVLLAVTIALSLPGKSTPIDSIDWWFVRDMLSDPVLVFKEAFTGNVYGIWEQTSGR